MAFQREWDPVTETYKANRSRTGPPRPIPSTGTVTAADGSIVSSSTTVAVPPATPVSVTLPGPQEPIIIAGGRINHRWWRFFNELYLRTGGPVDNINRVAASLLGAGTAVSVTTTSYIPTVTLSILELPTTASVSITGIAPTITVA